jgi:lipoprotein-anchoring transpeptidase ErfK/SrfK
MLGTVLLFFGVNAGAAQDLSLDRVNHAEFNAQQAAPEAGARSALYLKVQVLLDRHGTSPGVIDGRYGENVRKAVRSFAHSNKLDSDGRLTEQVWDALTNDNAGPVLIRYQISEKDMEGPFMGLIPDDYRKMSKMDRLGYRNPAEMLAERFHMDIDLLRHLNPKIEAVAAGDEIVVADPGKPVSTKVTSIKVEKNLGELHGYDGSGKLVVAYPATIGSQELPSPSGTHQIKAIAPEAAYYYDPKKNFKADGIEEELTLPPGPNNPIGTTWIDLDKPTYGIHGTPEPAEIDKEASHGCVRLTNWDVQELAELVEPGIEVRFVE